MSMEVLIKSPLKSTKSQDFCLTMAETKAERKLYHVTIKLNIPAVLHIGLKADMQMFTKNQYVPTVMEVRLYNPSYCTFLVCLCFLFSKSKSATIYQNTSLTISYLLILPKYMT